MEDCGEKRKVAIHWWDNVPLFTAEDWSKNFRVSKSTFDVLCQKLSRAISKEEMVMRNSILVKKRIALTLCFLATGAEYRTIGHLFGVFEIICMCYC